MPSARALRIPYYAQTAEFSCGAACLVMALAALRGTPRTRAMEFELWRDATMIGIPGIDKWGLTIPAVRRDVPATVISPTWITFEGIAKRARGYGFTKEQFEITEFIQRENRKVARAEGARWVRREPRPEDARDALARGRVPILFVDLGVWGGEKVPHWAVAARMNGERALVHDPDPDGPRRRGMNVEEMWAAMDVDVYGGRRTMVVLGP